MRKLAHILILLGLAWPVLAQRNVQVSKGFVLPHYEGNQLRALFSGAEARPITGNQGLVLVTKFSMVVYKENTNKEPELIVEAPECVFDRSSFQASSAGPLKVYTGQTNLTIEGRGFLCQQTNMLLLISNDVHTAIQKSVLRGTTNAAVTNRADLINISSKDFAFLYRSNLVTYGGGVTVRDPEMEMASEILNIHLTTNNAIKSIIARTNVQITATQMGAKAQGDFAFYQADKDNELLILTGNPEWSEPRQGSGSADYLLFDRKRGIFRCETNAVLRMANSAISTPGATNAPAGTNSIEMQAHVISIYLPPTNGPIQRLIAETNVVILDPANQSRATAGLAEYSQTNGLLELTGQPQWKVGEMLARGDKLILDNNSREFRALENGYLRMPDASGTVLEVSSDNYILQTNVLRFRGNVEAASTSGTNLLSSLKAEVLNLTIAPGNRIEKLAASQNVEYFQQTFGTNQVEKRTLYSYFFDLETNPKTGQWENFSASPKVKLIESTETTNKVITRTVECSTLEGGFEPGTNTLSRLHATGGVIATQLQKTGEKTQTDRATGKEAFMRTEDGSPYIEIIGNPIAETGGMRITDAITLRWYIQSGKFKASGPYLLTPVATTK